MATGDGKYITLDELKAYGIGTTVDPNDPTVYNGNVSGTPDDGTLALAIAQAEADFDLLTGSGFDGQDYSLVMALQPFVDGNGWLHLWARERGPVTAVTAVQVRNLAVGGNWQSITLAVADTILPVYETNHPNPESWHVYLKPSPALLPAGTGQILARWSYSGGYDTIPASLKNLINRMAWFVYKMREAPLGKVVNIPLGTVMTPTKYPPDVVQAINKWTPVYS